MLDHPFSDPNIQMVIKALKNKHTLAKIIIICDMRCVMEWIFFSIHIVVDVFVFGKLFEIARNLRRIYEATTTK